MPASARFRSLEDYETLHALVRRIREGIYITTTSGRILDANQALLEICGVKSLAELQALTAEQLLVSPEERTRELGLLKRDGAVRDFELEIRRPDGQIRTVIDTAYACRDAKSGEVLFHGILVDITARKRLEMALLEMSIRDPLTGCFNRRYLTEFEEGAGDHSWGCIVIDVDHFKDYNDRFGHEAGDDVLRRLTRFLMRMVRAEEGVVRTGGDEFVVLLSGANTRTTGAAARRILDAARKQAPVPFSLGWAARAKDEPLEKTISRADHKLLAVRVRTRKADRRSRD